MLASEYECIFVCLITIPQIYKNSMLREARISFTNWFYLEETLLNCSRRSRNQGSVVIPLSKATMAKHSLGKINKE